MAAIQSFNAFDWILVTALLVGLIYGYLRGVLSLGVGLLGYLAALFVAGRLSAPLVAWADRQFGVVARTAQYVGRYLDLPEELHQVSAQNFSPERMEQLLAALPLPVASREALAERLVEMMTADPTRSVAELIFYLIASGIVTAVAFVLLLTVTGWLLNVAARLVGDLFDRVPLVGTVNHVLGAATAALMVLGTLAILTGLLTPVLTMPSMQGLGGLVNGSVLAPYLLQVYDWLAALIFGQANRFFLA